MKRCLNRRCDEIALQENEDEKKKMKNGSGGAPEPSGTEPHLLYM
jgi:hypothetical protein